MSPKNGAAEDAQPTPPIDLLAARAARAETDGDDTRFAIGDHVFGVPPHTRWDVDGMTALSQGDFIGFLRKILPEDQLAILDAAKKQYGLTMGDLEEIAKQASRQAGFTDPGELLASSTS